MPKMTMLEMTQNILSDMVSDPVNSISDTVEATAIAQVIQNTFYEYSANEIIPSHSRVFRLDASGDSDLPCEMILPTDIVRIDSIRYNKKKAVADKDQFGDVHYEEQCDFLARVLGRDSSASTTESMVVTESDDSVTIQIENNAHPTFYTTFGDTRVVFDSYYSTLDTTLQNSKTICLGRREPVLALADGSTLDIPIEVMPGFLAECKAICFNNFKQQTNGPAIVSARRGRNTALWNAGKVLKDRRQQGYPIGR